MKIQKIEHTVFCNNCNKLSIILETEKAFLKRNGIFYCSKQCKPKIKRVISEETKAKQKEGFRKYIDSLSAQEYKEKFSKNKSSLFFKSSKGETLLLNLLQERYPEYEFLAEDMVKHNGSFLSIDIYSKVKNLYIEYDGVWHFTDIRGQLERKQRKEALLADYCKINNIRLLRVTDHNYKKETELFENICKIIEDDSIREMKIYNFEKKKFMY